MSGGYIRERLTGTPWRAGIHTIVLKENVPAGMDFALIGGLAAMMRKTRKDPPPVEVRPLPCGHWLLEDGRHRLFGAIIAGRHDILAVLSPAATPADLPGSPGPDEQEAAPA